MQTRLRNPQLLKQRMEHALADMAVREGSPRTALKQPASLPFRDNSRVRQPDNALALPPAEAPAPTTTPRYNVQVEAAASRQQGRALVERLATAGHPAYVATAIVKNVEVFRVRVGPFDTLSEAKRSRASCYATLRRRLDRSMTN